MLRALALATVSIVITAGSVSADGVNRERRRAAHPLDREVYHRAAHPLDREVYRRATVTPHLVPACVEGRRALLLKCPPIVYLDGPYTHATEVQLRTIARWRRDPYPSIYTWPY